MSAVIIFLAVVNVVQGWLLYRLYERVEATEILIDNAKSDIAILRRRGSL
jgi:hypothetical protein